MSDEHDSPVEQVTPRTRGGELWYLKYMIILVVFLITTKIVLVIS